MRDPARINGILTKLQALWSTYPDQRFCQLISNIVMTSDAFYLEDDQLEKKIDKILKEGW